MLKGSYMAASLLTETHNPWSGPDCVQKGIWPEQALYQPHTLMWFHPGLQSALLRLWIKGVLSRRGLIKTWKEILGVSLLSVSDVSWGWVQRPLTRALVPSLGWWHCSPSGCQHLALTCTDLLACPPLLAPHVFCHVHASLVLSCWWTTFITCAIAHTISVLCTELVACYLC